MIFLELCLSAFCLFAVSATAAPTPQTDPTTGAPSSDGTTSTPITLPPPGPIVNITAETTKDGTVSILTSLNFPSGSGCSSDQQSTIQQAFLDALNIAGTVGGISGPGLIYTGGTPVEPYDWFGKYSDTPQDTMSRIMENLIYAQAPNQQWKIGDWWNDRYFDIFCNDPGDKDGHSCGQQGNSPGYEVEPSYRKDGGKYPLINFCPTFWQLESLASRVAQVESGAFGFSKDDVRSLVSQGSAFLHEMYHTGRASASGVSDPRCVDVTVNGYPGKAYGPSRAKMLARMTLGGPQATSMNVDNFVFYSIAWYMYEKWGQVPQQPKYSWPRISALIGPADDAEWDEDNSGDNADYSIESGPLWDDADFYSGTNIVPDGGDQPAAPTGAADADETIPGDPTVSTVPTTSSQGQPPPTTSVAPTCNCNEDGCTADSPACCANGTC